jgi:hypothetical protein
VLPSTPTITRPRPPSRASVSKFHHGRSVQTTPARALYPTDSLQPIVPVPALSQTDLPHRLPRSFRRSSQACPQCHLRAKGRVPVAGRPAQATRYQQSR